jgi:glycosyltransferase involved in cell wall biosynthesis
MSAVANLAIIIRFKNSAATLPGVLLALRAQTLQHARIIGIDTGSSDGSAEILISEGAQVVRWEKPYHHSKVLNFGMKHCTEEFVLVLSSHTVLSDPSTISAMLVAMADPNTACVSGKWSPSDAWSDAITSEELKRVGLRFCSIYSNSFGMIRRELWMQCPFDESLSTMEDYAWALAQLDRGYTCRRLSFPFQYQRSASPREFAFAATTFHLAHRYGFAVKWLGVRRTIGALTSGMLRRKPNELREHIGRLVAFFAARLSRGKFRPSAE